MLKKNSFLENVEAKIQFENLSKIRAICVTFYSFTRTFLVTGTFNLKFVAQ